MKMVSNIILKIMWKTLARKKMKMRFLSDLLLQLGTIRQKRDTCHILLNQDA